MTKQEVFDAAKVLDKIQIEELINDLDQFVGHSTFSVEQDAELVRRLEAIDAGEAVFVPGEAAIKRVRQKIQQLRSK